MTERSIPLADVSRFCGAAFIKRYGIAVGDFYIRGPRKEVLPRAAVPDHETEKGHLTRGKPAAPGRPASLATLFYDDDRLPDPEDLVIDLPIGPPPFPSAAIEAVENGIATGEQRDSVLAFLLKRSGF